jgi:hypothetical protein
LPLPAALLALGCRIRRIAPHVGLLMFSENFIGRPCYPKPEPSRAIAFMPSQMIKQDLCQPGPSLP